MSIVSSQILEDAAQKDGRRWIRELHIDQAALRYIRAYLTTAVADASAALAAYATQLALDIVAAEIAMNIAGVMVNGSLATISLVYSTAAQNRTAGRAAYLNAARVEAIMIGDFLSSLTDAQLQTIFSMTAGQVTTLRTNKLTPAATSASAIRAAAGQ